MSSSWTCDDLKIMTIRLEGAVNQRKGGRLRKIAILEEHKAFLLGLEDLAVRHTDGPVFTSWRSLPSRARVWVRGACTELEILPLGTHGARKTFATREFLREEGTGKGDGAALLAAARQLGHNRTLVVRQSYLKRGILSSKSNCRTQHPFGPEDQEPSFPLRQPAHFPPFSVVTAPFI